MGRGAFWTDREIEIARELRDRGASYKEIAARPEFEGRSPTAIHDMMVRRGLATTNNEKWPVELLARAVELRSKGVTVDKIALMPEFEGYGPRAIRSAIRRAGLETVASAASLIARRLSRLPASAQTAFERAAQARKTSAAEVVNRVLIACADLALLDNVLDDDVRTAA